MIIDSSGVYLERSKPDIVILTQSPKINLDRLLENYIPNKLLLTIPIIRMHKNGNLVVGNKNPFHATAEKGFFN
jgi:competence protein ComEC